MVIIVLLTGEMLFTALANFLLTINASPFVFLILCQCSSLTPRSSISNLIISHLTSNLLTHSSDVPRGYPMYLWTMQTCFCTGCLSNWDSSCLSLGTLSRCLTSFPQNFLGSFSIKMIHFTVSPSFDSCKKYNPTVNGGQHIDCLRLKYNENCIKLWTWTLDFNICTWRFFHK